MAEVKLHFSLNPSISKHASNMRDLHFDLVTFSSWLQAADRVYKLFTEELTSDEGHEHSEAMITLRDDMETEIMFSELR